MANTSNVIQFIVKGGKAAARKIKMQADAMRGYVKQLKIFDKEGLVHNLRAYVLLEVACHHDTQSIWFRIRRKHTPRRRAQ